MIKVYIASPYTLGNVEQNVKNQIDCFDVLVDYGYIPYAPLWCHFQHLVHPRTYHEWTRLANEWVKVCDCVLRLPGESLGADNEVKLAIANKKRVFLTIESMNEFYDIHR